MVTAVREEDKVSTSRTVKSEDPDLGAFLPVNLAKMISTMIMRPPEAKPNPSTEYTEIRNN